MKNDVSNIKAAVAKGGKVTLDELDCSQSFARQKTKRSLDEILEVAAESTCFHNFKDGVHLWRVMGQIDYFIWVEE